MTPSGVSPAAAPLAYHGHRLVGDDQLPPWLHTLVAGVDGAELPGQLGRLVGTAPADARRGAVLMLFGEGAAGPDLLLTERAATMRSHAGQPAFPGGATDPGEDAVQAAARTHEQLITAETLATSYDVQPGAEGEAQVIVRKQ